MTPATCPTCGGVGFLPGDAACGACAATGEELPVCDGCGEEILPRDESLIDPARHEGCIEGHDYEIPPGEGE